MKIKNLTLLLLQFLFAGNILAQIPNNYYLLADCSSGKHLKTALHNIIKNRQETIPYSLPDTVRTDTWKVLKRSDYDTLNPKNVILFYTGKSVNSSLEYSDGKGWNREHVWAVSHGKFGENKTMHSDLHNLKPSNSMINPGKGNKDFDNGGKRFKSKDGELTECRFNNHSWEPRDCDKGDVARILFYMAVRYEGDDGNPDLELADQVNTASLTTPGKGFYGKLTTLLEWNKLDPVDEFERRRNNVIFKYQKNRNPFIDHPEYADLIWGMESKNGFVSPCFNIYPLPATNILTLEWNGKGRVTGKLVSPTGLNITEFGIEGKKELYVTNLAPGEYSLILTINGQEFIEKVILK
jgi:endonuclease I